VYPDVFCGTIVSADGKCLKKKLVPGSKGTNVFDNVLDHCEREPAYTSFLKPVLVHLPPSRCFARLSRHNDIYICQLTYLQTTICRALPGMEIMLRKQQKCRLNFCKVLEGRHTFLQRATGKPIFEKFKLNLMQFSNLTRKYGNRSNPQ
jgi:hypothetical protein